MINIQTNPQITDLAAQILAMQGDVTDLVNAAPAGTVFVQRGSADASMSGSTGLTSVTVTMGTTIDLTKSFLHCSWSAPQSVATDHTFHVRYYLMSNTQIQIFISATTSVTSSISICWEVVSYA